MNCYACRINALPPDSLPPRESVYDGDGLWRVAHAFDSSLAGWMVLVARRHVTSLGDLTNEESSALGPLLAALSRALEEEFGVPKAYVVFFAEGVGFEHLHIHVVPRPESLPKGMRGPGIFGCLGSENPVEAVEMDEISTRTRSRMG